MTQSTLDRAKRRYWDRSKKLVMACLLAWLGFTLLPLVLARIGASGTILGWPAVFAFAAFGVPVLYLVIIGVYSIVMDRIEGSQTSGERDL